MNANTFRGRVSLLFAALSLAPLLASAAPVSMDFKVLIDTDNREATGCTVVTTAGLVKGVDQVLTTSVSYDSVAGTAANVNDVTMAGALLHGDEEAAFGDAGYQGVHKRPEAAGPTWHVAMRPGKRKTLNPFLEPDFVAERVEKMKASVRAKVEHPFRVIKRQFGFTKVRYRGLAKNTAQIVTLFALSNLWMARRHLMGTQG